MTPPGSVFVSQFGLQHAQQLALALHEGGMLKAFWSAVATAFPEAWGKKPRNPACCTAPAWSRWGS